MIRLKINGMTPAQHLAAIERQENELYFKLMWEVGENEFYLAQCQAELEQIRKEMYDELLLQR